MLRQAILAAAAAAGLLSFGGAISSAYALPDSGYCPIGTCSDNGTRYARHISRCKASNCNGGRAAAKQAEDQKKTKKYGGGNAP